MAKLGLSTKCNLKWGPETAEGSKIASEVESERQNGAVLATDLCQEPAKRIAPSLHISISPSALSYLSGIDLPGNAATLARSLDVRCVHLQAELLKVGNRITLCSQGHGDFVMGCKQPQADANTTVAAKSAHEELFKESLASQRDDIMRKLAEIHPGSYTAPPVREETAKFSRKMKIPHTEYPSHNFVGWLLGTGGKSRQELERRTGARVFIRGLPSQKSKEVSVEAVSQEDLGLHVLVCAEEQRSVDSACELIQPLLDPRHPEHATAAGHFLAHVMSGQHASASVLGSATAALQHPLSRTTSAAEAAAAAAAATAAPTAPGPSTAATSSHYPQGAATYTAGTTPSLQNEFSLPGPPPQPSAGYAAVHQTYHPTPNVGVVDPHCKLFVGHLPNSIDDAMLHGLFSHYGQVRQAEVMRHRDTGLSRGFGFVHMQTREQAAAAISALNGYRLEGRILQVSVKSAKREPRQTWTYQQPAAPSYHHHLVAPDDLPPGVDPFTLPHSDVLPIYAWDTSYASGMPFIKTPIGTRAHDSSPPVLNLPPAASKGAFRRRFFAEPFSGNEVADAAGLPRAAYGVWARANVEYDPLEVPPGIPRPSHPGDMCRAGSMDASMLGPNGEALDAPVQSIPVSLSAEEKKRVERREATQEARAAAEAERRQRLLAAAAAAVKKSAPPASERPPKQRQKRAAEVSAKANERSGTEKRRSADASGAELNRQRSGSLPRHNSHTRESAENESSTGNKRPKIHSKDANSHKNGVSALPAYPNDTCRHTPPAERPMHSIDPTKGAPLAPCSARSQSDGEPPEPSESGEILESDAEDTAAAGTAPVAIAAASRDAPPAPSRSIASSSAGGGGGGGSVHGGGTPASNRSAPPLHPPVNPRPGPAAPPLDWDRDRVRDRDRDWDRYPDDTRGGSWKSGYGAIRGATEYPDAGGFSPRRGPPRRVPEGALLSPPSTYGPERLDRRDRERDSGNVRDGVHFRDLRSSRSRHAKDFDRFDTDRYLEPPDWPSPPHGPKGGVYRGQPPPAHAPSHRYMTENRRSRDGYSPRDWDRGRRGPPSGPGVPMDNSLGAPPMRRDWSMEREPLPPRP